MAFFDNVSNINKESLKSLVTPIFEMDEQYYSVFRAEDCAFECVMVDLINNSLSDIGGGFCYVDDETILGFYCAYDINSQKQKQLYSLSKLICLSKSIPEAKKQAHLFKELLSPLMADCYYLSKIFVEPSTRGKGVAQKLLSHYYSEAQRQEFAYAGLHVKKSNKAVSLYKKEGFEIFDDSATYISMVKRF